MTLPARLHDHQRGLSVSVLVCLLIPVLLVCMGLAVDGAAKAAADRRAEAVAAQAARAGLDAAAPQLVTGADGSAAALSAARATIDAHPGVRGEVSMDGPTGLVVTTSTSTPSVLLGLVGVAELPGRGSARVDLRRR